ncbi:MAG TPA: DNA-directed RNA polymerase subunit alpha [Armatimonadota bacterium]|jgi:DNA-directed RNA polymerase subunit alpha
MDAIAPKIETLVLREIYGKFVVEPLEQGFATTLGSALRRVLLSHVRGAAITSIKIDGVLHEFSTIPGVKEDATELILNLKDLAVKSFQNGTSSEETWQRTLRIDRQGEGEITGADIETPEDVEIVNPEVHIATISDEGARLGMELIVEMGKGYVLPERLEGYKHVIGTIPVGAAFTPVRKVSFIAEPTRVGGRTDLERLVMEVWTNGTIAPNEAVSEAAAILEEHLMLFRAFGDAEPRARLAAEDSTGREIIPDTRIEELDFSMRTYNCLKKANVLTVRDLVEKTEAELMEIRNFGKKSLDEVGEKLAKHGLHLKDAEGEAPVAAESAEEEETGEE